MEHSKIKYMAASPQDWWFTMFAWIKDNTILFMVFALGWKAIDKVFKYFSEARDAELRKIVHDEMNPSIKELSSKIQELGEAVWALKNK
jgi:hypothetical protein